MRRAATARWVVIAGAAVLAAAVGAFVSGPFDEDHCDPADFWLYRVCETAGGLAAGGLGRLSNDPPG